MTTCRKRTRKTYLRDLGEGLMVEAEVSPCVFMYRGHPLQISVKMRRHSGEKLAEACVSNCEKTAATYTEADARELLGRVRVQPCSRCSSPAFDPTTVETNRRGLCEACFLADLEAELEKEQEAERQKVAARDKRMKSKGFVARVTGWIHPEEGGDDHQMDWYFKRRPVPEQVRALLLEEGSEILDDFTIIRL
jgi:hypothetical protein